METPKVKCPDCGSDNTRWGITTRNKSSVADGRLRMYDVDIVCYLGCEECSCTIRTLAADQSFTRIEEALNTPATAIPDDVLAKVRGTLGYIIDNTHSEPGIQHAAREALTLLGDTP